MQFKTSTIVAIVLACTHAQAAVMGPRSMAASAAPIVDDLERTSQSAMAINAEQIVSAMNAALVQNGLEALTAEEIMEAMSAAGTMQSKAARSAEILDSNTIVEAIKAITDLSGSTADILLDLQNGGSIFQAVPKAIKNIKDIVTMATKDVALIGTSSSANTMFQNNDQLAICDAFSAFVKVHQDLLRVIIGDKSLLANTPFTAPIALALQSIEGIVDKLAFALIKLVPTCAEQAKKDQMALDATLDQAISAYQIKLPFGGASKPGSGSGGLLGGNLIPGLLKSEDVTQASKRGGGGLLGGALIPGLLKSSGPVDGALNTATGAVGSATKPGGLLGGALIPGLLKSAEATQASKRGGGGLLGGALIPGLLKSSDPVDGALNTATGAVGSAAGTAGGATGGLTGAAKPLTDAVDGATGGLTKPVSDTANGLLNGVTGGSKMADVETDSEERFCPGAIYGHKHC